MNAFQLEGYAFLGHRGDHASSRGAMTSDELLFISKHHYRGTSASGIAKMLNRSIPAVEAITSRLDPRAHAAAPAILPPDMPYVSPSIRLKLVPINATESMASIASRIAGDYRLRADELFGESRRARVVKPRQAAFHACYAVKREDGAHRWSLPQIGRFFGGRDHTTVLHGIRQHEKRLAETVRAA